MSLIYSFNLTLTEELPNQTLYFFLFKFVVSYATIEYPIVVNLARNQVRDGETVISFNSKLSSTS